MFPGLLYLDGRDSLQRPVVVLNANALPGTNRDAALDAALAVLQPVVMNVSALRLLVCDPLRRLTSLLTAQPGQRLASMHCLRCDSATQPYVLVVVNLSLPTSASTSSAVPAIAATPQLDSLDAFWALSAYKKLARP
jgi:hypothetical protein